MFKFMIVGTPIYTAQGRFFHSPRIVPFDIQHFNTQLQFDTVVVGTADDEEAAQRLIDSSMVIFWYKLVKAYSNSPYIWRSARAYEEIALENTLTYEGNIVMSDWSPDVSSFIFANQPELTVLERV